MPEEDAPQLSATPSARVLIVEDDRLTRQLVAAHVRNLGMTADEVDPSAAGIRAAAAAAGPDDVVILDIILGPDIDGFEVIRLLGKARFRGRVIIMSGFGPDYLRTLAALADALSIRVAGILEKPIRPDDLERCLV